MRTALFASLALALTGCGDPLLFAEVEDKQICLTMPSQTIPGAGPLSPDLPEQTVTYDGSLDLGSAIPGLDTKGTTGTIKSISLHVNSTTDMSVIRRADVNLSSVAGEPATLYMHYDRGQEPTTDPHDLTMIIDADVNLFQRLAGGKSIDYHISFTGSPPAADWTADVVACVSAKVQIDPLEAIKK